MEPRDYWWLKSKIAEANVLEERSESLIKQAEILRDFARTNKIIAFQAVKLDPSKNYILEDSKQSIILMEEEKVK